ncbi:oligosaccharide flippase family protein [Sporohalobacter salinus]|uniref:oligosaccharide flippase family protein n=1 Tax=Sporohalobacter salinus TaxID=1494606 RepID=UPI001960BAB8|nr:O-antigen/teichoic acid export membrane protein [Sporohalobacter salinus]
MNDFSKQIDIITKQGSLSFVNKIINFGLKFILQVILARLLGVKTYGIYILSVSLISILSMFVSYGMSTTLTKLVNKYRNQDEIKSLLLLALIIPILFSCLVLFIFILFKGKIINYFNPRISELMSIILLITLFHSILMNLSKGVIRGFKKTALSNFFNSVFYPGVKLILFLILFFIIEVSGLKAIFYSHLISVLITIILVSKYILSFIQNNRLSYFGDLLEVTKNVFKISHYFLFIGLGGQVRMKTDRLMLGGIISESAVGIYNPASRLAYFVFSLSNPLIQVYMPIVAEAYEKNNLEMIERLSSSLVRWITYILAFVSLPLLFHGKYILGLAFGNEFISGYPILVVLIIGNLVSGILVVSGHILTMTNKQDVGFINNIFIVLLNIILNFILIKKVGTIGAAIATSLVMFIFSFVQYLQVKRCFKISLFDFQFFKVIIGVIGMSFVYYISKIGLKYELLEIGIGGIISFLTMLIYIMKVDVREEDNFIFDKLMKMLGGEV